MITRCRDVVFVFATEAKSVPASTLYCLPFNEIWLLDDKLAPLLRTPLHVFILINHLLDMPSLILLKIIDSILRVWCVFQIFYEIRMRYDAVASDLRTF